MEILKMQPDTSFDAVYKAQSHKSDVIESSFARFKSLGLPNRRLEAWKYTSFEKVSGLVLTKASNQNFDETLYSSKPVFEDTHKLYFLNGALVHADETMAEYLSEEELLNEGGERNALVALNGAFVDKRYSFDIPENVKLEQTIEIFHLTLDGYIAATDMIFQIGAGADVTVLEHYEAEDKSFTNNRSSIVVESNANFNHHVVQINDEQAYHYNFVTLSVHESSSYNSFVLNKGAKLSRREVISHCNGEHMDVSISGVNLVDGDRLTDITLETLHNVPNGRSRQHFKTVLKDSATGVFQGKIFVERDAQQTDGYQMNNALLLSDKAQMNSKPQLEIYADDVKCSHGATTGQMDETALFYLRSRGLNKLQAQQLLIHAFIGEAIADIQDETIESYVRELSSDWFKD